MTRWLLILSVLLALSGCTTGRKDLVRTTEDYRLQLERVERLTRAPLEAHQRGDNLSEVQTRDLKEGLSIFEELIRASPQRFALHFGAAKVEQALGNLPGAKQRYTQAMLLVPAGELSEEMRQTFAEGHHQLARIAIFDHDYAEAFAQIGSALKAYPENPDFLACRASVEIQRRDLKAARATLDQALKIDHDHLESKRLLRLLSN